VKTCSRCKIPKQLADFHKNKYKKDGYCYVCKSCRSIRRTENRQKNKEYILAYEHTPEYLNRQKDNTFKRVYGITLEIYNEMVKQQKGLCKVCGKPENHKTKKNLTVDHDHRTGKVRGLLCHRCNVVLGLVDEKVSILKCFKNYLKENS
jgi:hypothetical protein